MSERDEFEAAWQARYPDHDDLVFMRSRFVPHGYANTRVNDGWAMWQAARATPQQAVPALTDDARASLERAVSYSRNFADSRPNLDRMAKEHIVGLCGLIEWAMLAAATQQATTALTDGQIKKLAGMHGGYLEDCDAWNFCGDRGLVRFSRSLLATSPVKDSSNG